ncbi:MAG: type II secretion system ATPase GspE [Thiotrichaceae bacterium]
MTAMNETLEIDDGELEGYGDTVKDVAFKDIPYGFAKRHGVVLNMPNNSVVNNALGKNALNTTINPLADSGDDEITVFFKPGLTPLVVSEVRRVINGNFRFEAVSEDDFNKLLANHYDKGEAGAKAMMDDLGDELDLVDIADALPEPEDLLEAEDDAPIIRLINALLTQAIKEDASDIHIETYENRMIVRLRVDGVLREVLQPPKALAPLVISRIKVMAKLDIAERRVPQDGRISLRVAGRPVDVRVSTLPSGHNERVVMRLLDKQAGRLNLTHLGMADYTQQTLQQLIQKPHGIVLVTGPTGSGKTTTLYAALTDLNDSSRNILTIEDPIEYYIEGIGQTQVNNKVDMSFARGLRAILRQDPDVVMIGEIRDLETGEIAVQASLTGHLVFSTLHTNTAVGVVTRLRDMGVEPYLLSSSLIGVIAQRLVRLLCEHCKEPYIADETETKLLKIDTINPPTLYHPKGCPHCNQSGYVGRSGIYELVTIDDRLRNMIHDGNSEQELEQYARTQSPSIRRDGLRLIMEGRTTLEEVVRVTREDV